MKLDLGFVLRTEYSRKEVLYSIGAFLTCDKHYTVQFYNVNKSL